MENNTQDPIKKIDDDEINTDYKNTYESSSKNEPYIANNTVQNPQKLNNSTRKQEPQVVQNDFQPNRSVEDQYSKTVTSKPNSSKTNINKISKKFSISLSWLISFALLIILLGLISFGSWFYKNDPFDYFSQRRDAKRYDIAKSLLNSIREFYDQYKGYPWINTQNASVVEIGIISGNKISSWLDPEDPISLTSNTSLSEKILNNPEFRKMKLFYYKTNRVIKVCFIPESKDYKIEKEFDTSKDIPTSYYCLEDSYTDDALPIYNLEPDAKTPAPIFVPKSYDNN